MMDEYITNFDMPTEIEPFDVREFKMFAARLKVRALNGTTRSEAAFCGLVDMVIDCLFGGEFVNG